VTVTLNYSRVHRVFIDVAKVWPSLEAFDVRLLVALYEVGGSAREVDLRDDMQVPVEAIQRSTRKLRASGYVERHGNAPSPITARLLLGQVVAEQALAAIRGEA